MGRIIGLAGMMLGASLGSGAFASLASQSKEAPDRTAGRVSADARPTPSRAVKPGRPLIAEAKLVTTAAKLKPIQPVTGQEIRVVATVENQAGPPSKKGLGFLVACAEVRGGPTCPAPTFSTILPVIGRGKAHEAVVVLSGAWPAGKYRLVAGTDVVFGNDMAEIELRVKSGRLSGVPTKRGEVLRQQDTNGVPRDKGSKGALSERNAGPGTVSSVPGDPAVVGADLSFAIIARPALEYTKGPAEIKVYESSPKLQLFWSASVAKYPEWRWQVSLQPFPSSTDAAPPGLLEERPVSGEVFGIDLTTFPPLGSKQSATAGRVVRAGPHRAPSTAARAGRVNTSGASDPTAHGIVLPVVPPGGKIDFYIRIVPFKDGQPVWPGSNTVVAHYHPGVDPDNPAAAGFDSKAQEKAQQAFLSSAQVYDVRILSVKMPVFEASERWGCIVVVANPYYQKFGHPLMTYKPGQEYCPPKDPDKMQKSTGEKVVEGLEGFGKAWDGLGWAFDQAQAWLANQFKELVPCEWLGSDAESTCEAVAKQVAATAIKVGLTAAGVPPTLPSLEGMGDLAKGEAADAAVEYTCTIVENEGGTCTPAMRAGLAKAYHAGLDQLKVNLQKQAKEPACGDVQGAKDRGLLPLPCFSVFPGTDTKPASGSVEEPPTVTVRVTRNRRPDPPFLPECRVIAGSGMTSVTKLWDGEYPWAPFKRAEGPVLPPLAIGKSFVVTLTLYRNVFSLGGETPAVTWWTLYKNGKNGGVFTAGTETTKSVGTPNGLHTRISCSAAKSQPFLQAGLSAGS